ncbi:FAD-dependent oxidoreductase (plasmid) [Bradyrhizobium sp. CB82]|uniref:NAD(P)/FAD-dependent oxidoreductase n=1 Tax=Bradyrhizobium sp. CB82 TaxID=3039159 RepID=UPI0024B1CD7C|nr:FAD-dependent oxidoreductase [Bradyrhizobium sp. CB82]WFU45558.1 FAD-dependent oxidoreductase [Bradyrhizobium sp. CB82]
MVAIGFARAAAAQGATVLPKTDVLTVNITANKVTGVTTTRGVIEGPIVVDAAGAWTRQVAEVSGISVPLVPTRQQLIVTEFLDGARADLPMVRIMDAAVYTRPCQGGFLWGVYEETPRFFEMKSLGAVSISRTCYSTSRFFVRPLWRSRINFRSCKRLRCESFVAAYRR